MEIFFTEEYDGPDCGKDSGLKIYMTLSVGTRSNNEKYVLVQVYRRNPECQNNRGFAVGLPGSINISLNLNTDENPWRSLRDRQHGYHQELYSDDRAWSGRTHSSTGLNNRSHRRLQLIRRH